MLLERNQTLIGIIVAIVVGVATVFAVGLSGGAFDSGIALTAYFSDAGSLTSGDTVSVAGLQVGTVKRVVIESGEARVDFLLESELVPNDSRAAIAVENILGRRALVIEPGDSTQPFVPGDVIMSSRTTTPIDLPELGDRTVELLETTDVDALQALTTALADITEDAREDVEDLLIGLNSVADIIVERRDDIDVALDRTERIAVILENKDDELILVIDQFGDVLDRLVDRREDITKLLRSTASATDIAADLLSDRRAQIDRILDELEVDLQIVDRHQVELAHLFAYQGVSFEGFASIGYEGGEAKTNTRGWGNVFVTGLGGAGIDALLGCGGTLDELFTTILGPDPTCETAQAAASSVRSLSGVTTTHIPVSGLFSHTLELARGTSPEVTR